MAEAATLISTRTAGYHLRMSLPPGFAARRHPFQNVLDEILEHRRIQLVDDLLPVALRENEPGVAEHAQVARDRRPRRREVIGDVAGRARTIAQETQYLAARRIGQGTEGSIHDEMCCCLLSQLRKYPARVSAICCW